MDGLSLAELTGPSAAREWTVTQVLSHLGSGAEIMAATLDAALNGPGDAAESNEQVWARWDAMVPTEQAHRFREADEMLVKRFESLDGPTRATMRVDLGFLGEPLDVADAAALRLNELALHTWDIQVMADPAAVLTPVAVEFLFRPLELLIGFIGQPDVLNGRQRVIGVNTVDPDRSLGLDLRETARLVGAPAKDADVLTIPAEALIRLAAGLLGPEYTPPQTQLASDDLTLEQLRMVFPGF